MALIKDARKIWHRLWSVRLAMLGVIFSSAQAGFEMYIDGQTHALSIVGALLFFATGVSRLVDQPKLHAKRKSKKA